MDHSGADRMTGAVESGARSLADSAQEAATRAGSYMQEQLGRAAERAQDLAQEASGQVEKLTGRPIDSWARDLRNLVRGYPLQAIAITVGVGYLLGKILKRD